MAKAAGGGSESVSVQAELDVAGEAGVASDDDNVEDPDYLMVRGGKASLPTMGTNFQVK